MNWNTYNNFSSEFLSKYHPFILQDVLHHIQAYIIYPLDCTCKELCSCKVFRNRIILALNVKFYNKAYREREDSEALSAIKSLLKIPEDHLFRELHEDAYPGWLLEKEFKEREEEKHFKVVYQLVWTLLRLAKTYQISFFGESRASINEALGRILGDQPITKRNLNNPDYLGGEKTYGKLFNQYRSVSHFVAAFEFMQESPLSLDGSKKIEEFLKIAQWFRERLLSLRTPNVKGNSTFLENNLVSLPDWITSQGIDIHIEPFQDKIEELEKQLHLAEEKLVVQ